MTAKADKSDIVDAYRTARARLKLGGYERYLAERLAVRVARLLGKREEGEREEDDPGDVHVAGGRAARATPLARIRANNPPA